MTDIARCPHCGTDFTPLHLSAEIERLRMLNDELHKLLDGAESKHERRECEYLALIEKQHGELESLRTQWEAAKREAEQWVHESGIKLGEAHKEIAQLKAERHTTKMMLEDVLKRHGKAPDRNVIEGS